MAETIHRAGVSWNGGEGEDVRAHEVLLGAQSLASSSAIEFGGDDTKSNPETLLVGALSSCHMLWFLGLARKKGFEIASYEDDAEAVLDGKRFSSATLRPTVRWAGRAARPRRDRGAPPSRPRALLHRQLGRVPGGGRAGMSAELPLSDIKVLDLSRLLPGGFCSLLLADLGAEVLKVEDTGMGDYIRWAPPYYGEDADQELGTRSSLYLALNRGKRSVRLDLKSDQGREALLRLVESHDVVIDGFRPGVLERLGVGYERMREANPGIVVCAITGYGQDGPNVERAGHDMNYLGLIGLLGLTGAKDGPPVQPGGQIADLGGGALMAAFGIMAALHERRRSGEGQYVDISMADGALSWLALVAGRYFCDGEVPRRGEQQLAGGLACYMPYEASDGWVDLRRPGAEVLGRLLQRGRAPRPGREAVRPTRLRGLARGRRGLQEPLA